MHRTYKTREKVVEEKVQHAQACLFQVEKCFIAIRLTIDIYSVDAKRSLCKSILFFESWLVTCFSYRFSSVIFQRSSHRSQFWKRFALLFVMEMHWLRFYVMHKNFDVCTSTPHTVDQNCFRVFCLLVFGTESATQTALESALCHFMSSPMHCCSLFYSLLLLFPALFISG